MLTVATPVAREPSSSEDDSTAFERIVRAHRLPAPAQEADAPGSVSAVSDVEKLRSAMESHPLESIDALARLRLLEEQETAELRARRGGVAPWYEQGVADIARKTADSAGAVLREAWTVRASSPADLLEQLTAIAGKDDRPVYLLIFCIVLVGLLRAIGGAGAQRHSSNTVS